MCKFSFEECKAEISYELKYPEEILSTRKDAARKLQISLYSLDKLRKEYPSYEFSLHGSIFFFNYDLRRYLGEEYPEYPFVDDFEEFERSIGYVLDYPTNKLLILKTAPRFLGISKYAFNKLRKAGEIAEYEFLGFKFFNKEELTNWKNKHSK